MKAIYNRELAKMAEQMTKDGADKKYLQMQMAEAPGVIKKLEGIHKEITALLPKWDLAEHGKSFEWDGNGNFEFHLALVGDVNVWDSRELTTRPGSKLSEFLYEIGQIEHVSFSEPSEEDPLYILVYGSNAPDIE